MATRAQDARPTVRVCASKYDGDLVVEVRERTLVIRPVRARRGGPAEVEVSVGRIYESGLRAKAGR
jgi:hypothetical protein